MMMLKSSLSFLFVVLLGSHWSEATRPARIKVGQHYPEHGAVHVIVNKIGYVLCTVFSHSDHLFLILGTFLSRQTIQ